MPSTTQTLRSLAIVASIAVAPVHAAEQWFLMARHGECAKVETLKRKVPDLGPVADPQSFAEFMRGKGHATTITERALSKGRAFEVVVPARELSLVFVTADWCDLPGSR